LFARKLSLAVLAAVLSLLVLTVPVAVWYQGPGAASGVNVAAPRVPGAAFAGAYYSTTFDLTENPLSESSVWKNGTVDGGSWGNTQTASGRAYGTIVNHNPNYDDSEAVLKGTWTADQWAQAHVFAQNQSVSGFQEVELRLRRTLSAGVSSGYEILFSCRTSNPYVQIVRWNGALNDFDVLDAVTGPGLTTGSLIGATIDGSTITAWQDGAPLLQVTDSTFTSGNPGIGFWLTDQTTTQLTDCGLTDFEASNAFAGGYYSTNFQDTENPMLESFVWKNGDVEGHDWQNVQTGNAGSGPNRAYGIAESNPPTAYDDPTAVVKGTWSGTQWVSATAYVTNQGSSAGTQEIELRVLSTMTANSITGYEVLFSVQPSDPYVQLVRWNGTLNNFTIVGTATLGAAPVTGDVMSVSVASGVFHVYKNGSEITLDDNTDAVYTTGNPGIGFWKAGGASAAMSDAGWSDFTASDGALFVAASASRADVNTAITASTTGSTVLIPPGSSSWTTGVTINKGIHLKGSGGGSVQGSSVTSRNPGTSPCNVSGSCAFTLETASGDGMGNTWIRGWKPGETVTARYVANAAVYITGTVESWNSGTGVLTLTVTAVGTAGAQTAWTFSIEGATIITQTAGTAQDLIAVTEPTTQSVEISDIQFKYDSGCGTSCGDMIQITGAASGKATLIHDLRCQTLYNTDPGECIRIDKNHGVFWRVYADCYFNWLNMTNAECTGQFVHQSVPGTTHASWTTASTFGAADTTGENNLYIEDCTVSGLTQTIADSDDNARVVWRHCLIHNSQWGSHGQESSAAGMRHLEIHDNTLKFNNLGDNSANQNTWFFMRGGTLVFTDNRVTDITSSGYGNRDELKLELEGLGRNVSGGFGHDGYACWGNGTSTFSNHGNDVYPYPRQIGFGYVDGAYAGWASSTDGLSTDPNLGYRGDPEPVRVWGNTIVGAGFTIGIAEYPSGQGDSCDGTPDLSADYVQLNRDYFYSTDDTAARPGYAKKTYPHPLRSGR
jgi:hypothetical protein